MTDIDTTLAERGTRYGEFEDHALVSQNIKSAMQDSKNWAEIDDDVRECLEMIAHKCARVLNGDSRYPDNFTDIAGYARLVEQRLLKTAARHEVEKNLDELEKVKNETPPKLVGEEYLWGVTHKTQDPSFAPITPVAEMIDILLKEGVLVERKKKKKHAET